MIVALKFVYRNYKDEIEERIVKPDFDPNRLSYIKNDMHPDGGWCISGVCTTRNARRSFELKRIIGPITEVIIDD